MVCRSHTDVSESAEPLNPRYFTPDALPVTTLPISRLGDRLRICWLAYPEARSTLYSTRVVR